MLGIPAYFWRLRAAVILLLLTLSAVGCERTMIGCGMGMVPLRVQVYDAVTGSPLEGALVNAAPGLPQDVADDEMGADCRAETDPQGRAEMKIIAGYSVEWYGLLKFEKKYWGDNPVEITKVGYHPVVTNTERGHTAPFGPSGPSMMVKLRPVEAEPISINIPSAGTSPGEGMKP